MRHEAVPPTREKFSNYCEKAVFLPSSHCVPFTGTACNCESSAWVLMKLVCSVKSNQSAFAEQLHAVAFSLSFHKSCAASVETPLHLLGSSCAGFTCGKSRAGLLLHWTPYCSAGCPVLASAAWLLEDSQPLMLFHSP